ncbi:hypothetical protein FGO68_gene11356 [Halteria grandinella]|uniref:Uncharacterized protein n=1 Tax=Halteria grandinella TaxID=5974 RepID=A0A8J8SV54_HALGN|nr:hypothetical protein FGO68_gene11356 [Halteria grandinella]
MIRKTCFRMTKTPGTESKPADWISCAIQDYLDAHFVSLQFKVRERPNRFGLPDLRIQSYETLSDRLKNAYAGRKVRCIDCHLIICEATRGIRLIRTAFDAYPVEQPCSRGIPQSTFVPEDDQAAWAHLATSG